MVHVWGPTRVPVDGPISMSTEAAFNGVSWFQNKALGVGTIKEVGRYSIHWRGEIVDWN